MNGRQQMELIMSKLDKDGNVISKHHLTVFEQDDVAWDKLFPYFIQFLEGCGYVGVHSRMEDLIGDIYNWETFIHRDLRNFYEKHTGDECEQ